MKIRVTVNGREVGPAARGAAGLPGRARSPVRLLHSGDGDGGCVAAGREPDPTEEQVPSGLEGNLCRYTGYHNIVRAVLAAARDPA